MTGNMNADEKLIIEMIDGVRRAVMNLYGGNLDHPALNALEHAAWEVRKVAENMVSAEVRRAT